MPISPNKSNLAFALYIASLEAKCDILAIIEDMITFILPNEHITCSVV